MKFKVIASLTFVSQLHATEINIDLNTISNVSQVTQNELTLSSEFMGYQLKEGQYRFAKNVDLDGIDWLFFYNNNQRIEKPNQSIIHSVTFDESFTANITRPNDTWGNQYYWQNGSSETLRLNHHAHSALTKPNEGFTFSVSPKTRGDFEVELYTHNWVSSGNLTACLNDQCATIKNDITTHMTSIKNSVKFSTKQASDTLQLHFQFTPRQFDYDQKQGYHAIEAIQVKELH